MKAHEIKKALKGLPHIKAVWVDAVGNYYTVNVRGTQLLDLTDEINEPADDEPKAKESETVENLTQLQPETATNKRKRK
jgi:hypothetical protein